jgi:gamma-glutamylaminecyclotransferase
MLQGHALFVYGSLKRGFVHHVQLAGADFEREAATAPGYRLVLLADYPALTRARSGCVRGELYRVRSALLERLDAFEGCPGLYERALVPLDDGSSAFGYVVDPARAARCQEITGGRWTALPGR